MPEAKASTELAITPQNAVDVAAAVLSEQIIYWAQVGNLTTRTAGTDPAPVTPQTALELCSVTRDGVYAAQRDKTLPRPTEADLELARCGDVIVMAYRLANSGFCSTELEVAELAEAVLDSRYSPAGVTRVANQPAKYLGLEHITPRELCQLLTVWGSIDFSAIEGDRIGTSTPSLHLIMQAAHHLGIDLRYPVGEENAVLIAELLERKVLTVSPELYSDPHYERAHTRYWIFVPTFGEDGMMSCEIGFRGQVVRSLITADVALNSTEMDPDLADDEASYIERMREISA